MNTNSKKAQLARINRKLANKHERLYTSRSWRELENLGDYHVVQTYTNTVVCTHVNLDKLELELSTPAIQTIDQKKAREGDVSMRLNEQFATDVYPLPWEFSDEEIDCIAEWEGHEKKGAFSLSDERLIKAYGLRVELRENTYTKFAAILRAQKAEWGLKHPADANLRCGEKLLEAAIDACSMAGMSKDSITVQVDKFCHLNGL